MIAENMHGTAMCKCFPTRNASLYLQNNYLQAWSPMAS